MKLLSIVITNLQIEIIQLILTGNRQCNIIRIINGTEVRVYLVEI